MGYGSTVGYGAGGFTGYSVGYSYWASGCYGSSCFGGCYGTAGIGCFGWTGGFATEVPVAPGPQFTDVELRQSIPVAPQAIYPNAVDPARPVAPPAPMHIEPAVPKADKAPGVPNAPPIPDLPKVPAIPGPMTLNLPVSQTVDNRASIVVHLPAGAKLWVDGVPCPLQGSTRAFHTPDLIPGAEYAYTLTMENAGGRQERRVAMSAGRTVVVDFDGLGLETVSK